MVLRVCRACTALFAPGLARCPQCQADDHYEQGSEEQDMPKTHRNRGPSYAEGEMPEEVAQQLADRPEPEPAEPGPAEDYSTWTYNELQAEAKDRGLTATGSHQVLVERLVEHDHTQG